MEGGIYVQEVIIQKQIMIERGNIDICAGMVGKRNLQNIH